MSFDSPPTYVYNDRLTNWILQLQTSEINHLQHVIGEQRIVRRGNSDIIHSVKYWAHRNKSHNSSWAGICSLALLWKPMQWRVWVHVLRKIDCESGVMLHCADHDVWSVAFNLLIHSQSTWALRSGEQSCMILPIRTIMGEVRVRKTYIH